jgi:hypothetical protein
MAALSGTQDLVTLTPPTLRLGLRFLPSQATKLREIADQCAGLVTVDASLYTNAADATDRNEPLIVFCSSREEIEGMAYGFARLGIERPVIEELNG